MESIGRDNIKTSSYVVNQQLKDNNKFRPLYTIGFVFIVLLITIAYASLAMNFGVKVHDPRPIPPDVHGDDVIPEPTPEPTPDTKPNPKPYRPPVTPPPTPPKLLDWRIEFEELSEFAGSQTASKPAAIDDTKTGINFEVKLNLPGEYYKFKVDVANRGNYDAKIYTIIQDNLTPDQARYLDLIVKYDDGSDIKIDDELHQGEKKTIVFEVRFKEDIVASDLPQSDTTVDISYQIVYVEK